MLASLHDFNNNHFVIHYISCCVSIEQVLKVLDGHSGDVFAIAVSVDNGRIMSGSDDETVRVWSAETGQVLEHVIAADYVSTLQTACRR